MQPYLLLNFPKTVHVGIKTVYGNSNSNCFH